MANTTVTATLTPVKNKPVKRQLRESRVSDIPGAMDKMNWAGRCRIDAVLRLKAIHGLPKMVGWTNYKRS